jgi:hydrogenase expression/formation protein HypD
MSDKNQFRDPVLIKRVAHKIRSWAANQSAVKICHVCGTHEWTITHFGLRSLLPSNVEVIAGPGCPVCIVPASEIDEAIQIGRKGVAITCFGDLVRVPGSEMSLLDAKAIGVDVRIVYSVSDAVEMAENEPDKEFVFFAVGFETTSPSTAVELTSSPPENLSFLVSHRVIPPAMKMLVEMKDLNLDGFIAPGHVSTIIGLEPYEVFPRDLNMPVVVTGFEPVDVMFGIYMILRQLYERKPRLENEYVRGVRSEGNRKAQELLKRVFHVDDGRWRGLGEIPASKLFLSKRFEGFDAHVRYDVEVKEGVDIQRGCRCHLVVIGKIRPSECPLFMTSCTPQKPVGACMVSVEGTCRIWAKAAQSFQLEF